VATDQYRVVGVIVQPTSRQTTVDAQRNPNCQSDRPVMVSEISRTDVTYTYSVEWRVLIYLLVVADV
jgi:hypothetical protein